MATLFIGIGSSGLRVLEEAQQFNYEFTGKNKPDDVHYLYLETDLSNKPRKTPLGTNDIVGVELSLSNMAMDINQFKNDSNIESSWIPDTKKTLLKGIGAGGLSSYGRLALWSNFNAVKTTITAINNSSNGIQKVYVIGSLTGGTGSGVLIDIAYLVRQLIVNVEMHSILMIPSYSDLDTDNSEFFINSYYAIKSLEYYTLNPKAQFDITWPDGIKISNTIGAKAPYDNNLIVSPDYFNQSSITNAQMGQHGNLGAFFKTMGLQVFLFSQSMKSQMNLQSVFSAILLNAKSPGHVTAFMSIGISMIQYPKALLEEYIALEYANEIIDDWVSQTKYKKTEDRVKDLAKLKIEESINKITHSVLDNISHKNSSSVSDYLRKITDNVIKKQFASFNNIQQFLHNIFKADDNNLYFDTKNNLSTASDNLIIDIDNGLNTIIGKNANLSLAKRYLQSTEEHLGSLIDFWNNEYRIDENESSWNKILNRQINILDKKMKSYEFVGLKKEFINEQLENIAQLMRIHLIINELKIIKVSLSDPQILLKTQNNNLELLSVSSIENMEKKLLAIKGNEKAKNSDTTNINTFSNRLSTIIGMSNSFGLVFNLYPQGSFDAEVKNIKAVLTQKKINKNIINFGSNLIKFIKDSNSLYFHILSPLVSVISNANNGNVQFNNLLQNVQNDKIVSMLTANQNDLSNSPPALIKLDNNTDSNSSFRHSPFMNTIYIHNNQANITNVINTLRKNKNLPTINLNPASDFVQLGSMSNAVCIFKSYAFYSGNSNKAIDKSFLPSRDIASIISTRKSFIKDDSLKNNDHIVERIPYFNAEQIKENLLKNN